MCGVGYSCEWAHVPTHWWMQASWWDTLMRHDDSAANVIATCVSLPLLLTALPLAHWHCLVT